MMKNIVKGFSVICFAIILAFCGLLLCNLTEKNGSDKMITFANEESDYGVTNNYNSGVDDFIVTPLGVAYYITYDVNGGNALTSEEVLGKEDFYTSKEYFALPIPSRLGCDFVGWFAEIVISEVTYYAGLEYFDENNNEYAYDSLSNLNLVAGNNIEGISGDFCKQNLNLIAKWAPINYVINFHDNDENTETNVDSINYTVENEITTLPIPTNRDGYVFYGWFNNEMLSGSKITSIPQGSTGNLNLYAKWAQKTYIYDYIISKEEVSGYFNSYYNVFGRTDIEDFTYRVGEKSSNPNFDYEIDVDRLYGENNYYDCEIHFPEGNPDYNYADFTFSAFRLCNGIYKIYGNTNFTNDSGFGSFVVDGGTLILAGGNHFAGGDMELFATLDSGKIELNGGIVDGNIDASFGFEQGKQSEISITNNVTITDKFYICVANGVNIIDEGYIADDSNPSVKIFLWGDWELGDVVVQNVTTALGLQNYELDCYAYDNFVLALGSNDTLIIDGKTFEISYYDENNITVDGTGYNEYKYGYGLTTLLPMVKDGYVFDGWYNEQVGGTKVESISPSDFDDISLWARWTVVEYRIYYIMSGGTNNSSNPTKYTIETPELTLLNPTKDYYEFKGWTYLGQSIPKINVKIPMGSTGNKTFTANWELIHYSLTVNATNVNVSYMQAKEYYTYESYYVGVIFQKKKGYDIPNFYSENFTLTIGGEQINYWSNMDYDYNQFSIGFNPGSFRGDIVITATATEGNVYWYDEGIRAENYSTIDTTNKTLTITTAEELGLLCYDLNYNNYNTIYEYLIKIGSDINLTNYKWMPMQTAYNTFDGQGHTISGIDIRLVDKGRLNAFGFFSSIRAEESGCRAISDLVLKGSISGTASGDVYVGGLLGVGVVRTGDIRLFTNIATYIDIDITSNYATYIGGLAGEYIQMVSAPTCFKNCYSMGNINYVSDNTTYVGGLIGRLEKEMLYNCYYGGEITVNGVNDDLVNGIVGESYLANFENVYCSENFSVCGSGNNIEKCSIVSMENMQASEGENALVTKLNKWLLIQNSPLYRMWQVNATINNGMPTFADNFREQYAIEYDLTHLNGSKTIAYVDDNNITTLTCVDGYSLPENISIKMGDADYTEFNYDSTNGNITITGTINDVIKIMATAVLKTYTISYTLNSGINNSSNQTTYTTETATITLQSPTRVGYSFAGWFANAEFNGEAVTAIELGSTGDKALFAKWTANTNTAYKIKFYKQQLQNNTLYDYVENDDITLYGTTDTLTTIVKDTNGITDSKYLGYNIKNIENVNILPNGSAEVKVYYIRNLYSVTINANDANCGSVNITSVANVPYGTQLSVNGNVANVNGTNVTATIKTSTAQYTYSFVNWTNGASIVDGNKVVTANFAKTINNYTITWKNGEQIAELDGNVEYGTLPIYNGTTPTKTSLDASYKWEFKAWSPTIANVSGNAIYTATFNKILLIIASPSVDPLNPEDEDRVESQIDILNGVEDNVTFIVKVKEKSLINNKIIAPKNQEIIKSYNAQLIKNNENYTSFTGTMRIQIATPVEMKNRKNVQIIIMDSTTGTAVTKTINISGDYLIFETNTLGDFAIVADIESNLLWLWIILACVLLALIVFLLLWIFVFNRKVIFMVESKEKARCKYKFNQIITTPTALAGYNWFNDREMKVPFTQVKMKWLSKTIYGKQIEIPITTQKETFVEKGIKTEGQKEIKVKVGSLAKKYLDKLNALSEHEKLDYCEIKNELLSYYSLNNSITQDGDTFKFKNHTYVKISVLQNKLRFFVDLHKEDIDGRFKRYDASKFKKYSSVPLEFTIDRAVEVRKAKNTINRIAKRLNLDKTEVVPRTFKELTLQ